MKCIRQFTCALLIIAASLSAHAQWKRLHGSHTFNLTCVSVADRNAFIGTSGDGVFQSTNNGKTWNVVRVGLSDDSVNFVKIYGDLVCIGTDNGGFYISKDKGVSWNKANVGLGNRKLNCMTMCGTGLYVGTDSGIYRSTNDGLEWKAVNTGLTNTDVRSMMVYSTVIYAGTWGGGIFVSRDYGGVWRYIALKERYITDMLLVNLYAYAATTSGIVKSSDLGWSWYEFALPFNSVNCVHYAAGVFLAGTDVGMQRSTDYGARWQYVGGDTRKISAIAGNGSFLCAAASTGAGLMSVDTGQSWTEIDIGKRNVSVGSLIVDKNHVFVAEEDGTIQSCTLEDYHWNTVYASPSRKLVSCFTSHGTDYYAGSRSGVLKSTNGTTAWTMLGLPDNDIRALLWSDACLYAGTFSSGLFKSPDGGLTWSSLGLMHRTITSVFVNNKRVFACTDSGLYSTTNSGQQWRELGEGTIHKDVRSLVCIGTTLYAGTYGGGVFVSYDDGEKWTAFNAGLSNLNVQSLVAYGSKLFVGTNGSGVFVFLNKFKEWIQCNVGLPARDVQSLYLYNSTLYAGTTGMSVFALYLHSIPFGVDSSLYNGSDASTISISPVPAATMLDFSYVNSESGRVLVTVFNSSGAFFKTISDSIEQEGERMAFLDVSCWPQGLYCLVVQTPTGLARRTFLIAR